MKNKYCKDCGETPFVDCGCKTILSTDCVIYQGDEFPDFNIYQGSNLTYILYKIFDNLRRSLLEISIIIFFIYLIILKNALNVKTVGVIALIYVSFLMPFLFFPRFLIRKESAQWPPIRKKQLSSSSLFLFS